MISFTHTSKSYTDRTLWSDFHHIITSWDKIALIWPNWCGKSTMLACITGDDSVDAWTLHTKWLITHIAQEISSKYLSFTIEEYRYQYLPSHDDLYLWYIAMDDRWVQFDLATHLSQLSWGQRKIIQLMTLQFKPYDIILLDEPTNHLDIEMKTHLSDYLSSTKSIVVCVTHDRWFINQRATQVRDFDHSQIKIYTWDYDDYLILHEQAQLAQQHAHDSVTKELDRQAQVLAEFKRRSKISSSPKRGKMIRTRSKIIERMHNQQPDKVIKDASIQLHVANTTRSGKQLVAIQNLDVMIAGRILISDINLTINSWDTITIVWPNWCGKTTLIKEIIRWLEWKNTSHITPSLWITYVYIDQHNSQISWSLKVIDWYDKQMKWAIPQHSLIAQLLNAWFTHGQMQQKIDSCSYGQKLKLTLLTSIQSAIDILILDEPTNHCDIVTIEAIERMISQYSWAILLISHDPYFIANSMIDTIYHIRDCKIFVEQL